MENRSVVLSAISRRIGMTSLLSSKKAIEIWQNLKKITFSEHFDCLDG